MEQGMTEDDEDTNEFVKELTASEAEVCHITREQEPDETRVQFNLTNEDHLELVRELADKHDYERVVDGISLFELRKVHEGQ